MHKKDEYGIWVAYGEDRRNGGMYDRKDTPLLGYFEGEYGEVLRHVSKQRGWKSWGKGGTIVKLHITKL